MRQVLVLLMGSRKSLVLAGVFAASFLAAICPAQAAAVVCGSTTAKSDQPVLGTLTFVGKADDTKEDFNTDQRPVSLYLDYKVSGCFLRQPPTGVNARVRARGGTQDAFRAPATLTVEGGRLVTVEVPIDGSELPAGTHTVTLTVGGDAVSQVRTDLTVQSKTPLWPGPLITFIVGVLVGYVAAFLSAYLKASGEEGNKPIEFARNPVLFIIALFGAAAAGGAVFASSYLEAANWAGTETSYVLLGVAVATGAAGGRMTGVFATGVTTKVQARRQPG